MENLELQSVSDILDLPCQTRQIMYVYYYQCREYISTNPGLALDLLAAACVNLACKQTSVSRKLRDIVNVFYYLVHQQHLEINELFWKLKDSVIQAEFALLRILKFNADIDCCFVELIELIRSEDRVYGQVAWSCLNDLLSLDRICQIQLEKKSKTVALGAMWMALKLLGKNVPIRSWCEQYDTKDQQLILEIASLGMKQYQTAYSQHL